MSPGLSDPNWWPAPPPPKPAPKIPTSAILIGGIVAVVAAVGIAFALLDPRPHHSSGPSAPVRSLAAFEACLNDQGVLIPSAETNDAMLRPAALACRSHVPLLGRSHDPVAAAEKAYQACAEAAQSKLRSSQSSFGAIGSIVSPGSFASARASYEKATAVCRAQSFDEAGGGGEGGGGEGGGGEGGGGPSGSAPVV
jgi:hypothetical protein